MSAKSFLGSVSPGYGAISGEGMMGEILNPSEARKIAAGEKEEAEKAAEAERRKQSGMKKGGKVSSASSRADGCAQRGKTKGRMV